jgi:hypothetical protein
MIMLLFASASVLLRSGLTLLKQKKFGRSYNTQSLALSINRVIMMVINARIAETMPMISPVEIEVPLGCVLLAVGDDVAADSVVSVPVSVPVDIDVVSLAMVRT